MRIASTCIFCLFSLIGAAQEVTLTQYTTIHGLPQMRISSVAIDSLGYVWITSPQNGVASFDGKTFKTYRQLQTTKVKQGSLQFPPSLLYANNNIYSTGDRQLVMRDVIVNQVVTDAIGNTWIATEGAGLARLTTKNWKLFRMRGVSAVDKSSEGQTWFGSYIDGLWKIEGDGKDRQSIKVADLKVRDIYNDGTNLWCATQGELGFIANDQFQRVSDDTVYAMTSGDDDVLWCAGSRGLISYDGGSFVRYDVAKLNFVYYRAKKNSVLFGNEKSIYTLIDNKVAALAIPGLESTPINSVSAYNDSLLVAATSGGGILFLNEDLEVVNAVTSEDGLPSDFVTFADVDRSNDLWIGSNLGISRLKFDEELQLLSVVNQPAVPGINSMESVKNSYYLDDEKMFGLIDGLYCLNNAVETGNEYHPHFSMFQTTGQAHVFPDVTRNYIVQPGEGDIAIHFNKVNGNGFSYRLLPRDEEWHRTSQATQVTYPALEPGKYTFEMRALSNDGTWSLPQQLRFEVEPKFSQTLSFRIAIVIVAAMMLASIIYWVMKAKAARLLKAELDQQASNAKIRKEIARDFHDETGNQLSLIISYSSLLRNQKDRTVPDKALQQIEESAQKLYYGTKDFIWSIDPVNDEVSNLFIHIKDLGEKLFEPAATFFRASSSIHEATQLPVGTSRQISLICREALNNAFRYAQAKNVTFAVSSAGTLLEFSISDDGVGFDPDNLQKTSGLDNMRHRAKIINATIDITSKPSKGTTITLIYGK